MKNSFKDPWEKGTAVESNHYNWKGDPIILHGSKWSPFDGNVRNGELAPADITDMTMIDLFSGCGGFSAGFEMAGFTSILAVDIHEPSLRTYLHNHPWSTGVLGDIRRISDESFLELVGERHVDVITAGVPCQGHSLNNRKRFAEDERNYLFREFIRVVKIIKPTTVLLENVLGIRSSGNGKFEQAISCSIEEAGYDVTIMELNAADFGVPQARRRVFFVGVPKGERYKPPRPSHGSLGSRPYVTVWEAIGDLPQIRPGCSSETYDQPPFSDYQRLMRLRSTCIQNHIAPMHPKETIEKIAKTLPGQPMYESFKQRIRLHPDQLSPTQVSGGIRPQFQFGHPKLPRGLTVRERCRIQSFPDTYHILGGVVQGRYQTGNAVPPLLANAVARTIVRIIRPSYHKERIPEDYGQLALF